MLIVETVVAASCLIDIFSEVCERMVFLCMISTNIKKNGKYKYLLIYVLYIYIILRSLMLYTKHMHLKKYIYLKKKYLNKQNLFISSLYIVYCK